MNRPDPDSRIPWPRVFLLGLAAGFLSLAPAILPWGGRFVTRGDFIEQQLPFLLEAQRILRSGLNAYSFSTFLGAPALGSYAFYTLGSPFVWPLALLTPAQLPYGIAVMAVLKHAFALLFAFLWLRRLLGRDQPALLCALLYAFSSFTVVNTQFYHFWEVIAFFPLILLGLEDAMDTHPHPGLLGLFCGLGTRTNYYFMFSSALLAGLYFLFRLASPEWKKTRSVPRCCAVIAECAIGCALSGVLLLPALRFMMQITRTGARDSALLLAHYTPSALLERLRALLMPIESGVVHAWYGDAPSWSSCAAHLPVFGLTGTLVFLSFPGEQRWLRRLLLLLALCSCVPVLCGAFALWSNLDYTRWWYGLSALQALATGYALCQSGDGGALLPGEPALRQRWLRAFLLCSLLCLALVLPGLLPAQPLEGASGGSGLSARLARAVLNRRTRAFAPDAFRVLSLALALTGGAVLLFLLIKRPGNRAAVALVALAACCQYSAYIAVGDALIPAGGSEPGSGRYTLRDIAEPTLSALELPAAEGYVRIDYGTKLRNYGLIRGVSSLTCFQSLRSSTVGRFITAAGFGYDESTTITPPDASGALRAFLSVSEYHQTDPQDAVPEGFVYDREENGFAVWRNPNAVPMGFLMTGVAPDFAVRLSRASLGETLLNCAVLDEAAMRLTDGLPEADPAAFTDWQSAAAELRENACDSFRTRSDGFDAHIDAASPGLLVFTIPYDKGFTATVDGVPAAVIPCDLSFMAVRVEEGAHEISFTYRTRGLPEGILLSLLSAICLVLFVLLRKKALRAPAIH